MNILLTNDDGYESIGIHKLKDFLKTFGDVTIVAPLTAMSGKSCAILYGFPVSIKKVEENVYAMEGTPADCVAFGLSSLNKKFDLVVSGANNGFNISFDILYSGTVGACLQSLTYRVPAVAISVDFNAFYSLENNLKTIFEYIKKHNLLDNEHFINVNIPNTTNSVQVRETTIHYRKENAYYEKVGDQMYLAKRDILDHECKDENTDAWAVYHNYISISKLNKIY